MGFFTMFGKNSLLELKNKVTDFIALNNPELATQAELDAMLQKFEELSGALAKAKMDMDREQKEADEARSNFNKYIDMRDIAAKRIEDGIDVEKNTKSLNTINDTLAKMHDKVKREIDEAEVATSQYNELNAIVKQYWQTIETAKERIAQSASNLKVTKAKLEQAEQMEQRQREIKGLTKEHSSINVASTAMDRKAAELQAKLEASKTRTELMNSSQTEADSLKDLEKDLLPSTKPTVKNFEKF
jgi:chromosome segregation ATPase